MGIISSETTTILSVIIPESVAENVSRAACIASTSEMNFQDNLIARLEMSGFTVDTIHFYNDVIFEITVPRDEDIKEYEVRALAVVGEEVGRLQKLTSDIRRHNPHPGM